MKLLHTVVGTALFALTLNVFAADAAPAMGTEAEAQAMSEKALAEVDKSGEAAFDTFAKADGGFQDKDLYVFCMDLEGKMLSHPKKPELVGKNLLDFDKYGDKLFQNMVATAKSAEGKGWVDYKWPYPVTEELKAKKSYVIKNTKGFFCGVGAYATEAAAPAAAAPAPAAPAAK